MTKSLHIVADTAHPTGGHAVIRLDGIWLLPQAATFRIEPLDEAIEVDRLSGWPKGDQEPEDVRTTSRGIELLIGPKIVDAPDLLPGTPVTVSVPAAEIEAELRWPDLPLSQPVKAVAGGGARSHSPIVAPANLFSRARPVNARLADNEDGMTQGDAETTEAPAALAQLKTRDGATYRSARAGGEPEPTGRDAPASPNPVADQARPVTAKPKSRQEVNLLTSPLDSAANDTRPLPSRAGRRAAARPEKSPLVPLLGGLAVTAGLLGAVWFNLHDDLMGRPQPFDISEVFAVGDTSPQGTDATAAGLEDALLYANQFVHGRGKPRDKSEAAFWLKKSLTLQPSNEQMRWALTQLGTVYVAPPAGQQPNYEAARVVWELAAANGDPIALCFAGRLHERGLGVPANRERALASYKRAKGLGGCAGLDAAIARVTE